MKHIINIIILLIMIYLIVFTLSGCKKETVSEIPIETNSQYKTDEKFVFSHDPLNDLLFIGRNKQIVVQNLPKTDDFKYIWMWLSAHGDDKLSDEIVERVDDITYSFDVPDGDYYFNIYTADEQYTTYNSFLFDCKGVNDR